MLKFSTYALLPALVLSAGAVLSEGRTSFKPVSPERLYERCKTIGTKEYHGRQCVAFRVAADKEVMACMEAEEMNMQGFRARYLTCVEKQRARFAALGD